MRPDDLSVDVSDGDGAAVLTVGGELDMDTAPILGAALDEVRADQRVLLDLSRLRFMDSSGLKVLLSDQVRRLASGGSLHICHPSPQVRLLVEVTGLSEFLFDGSAESAAGPAHLTSDVTSTG